MVVVMATLGWPGWWRLGHAAVRPDALGESLAVVEVTALLAWRRWPVVCFIVAEVALVAYGLVGYPATPAGYAGLVATGIAGWGGRGPWVRYACLLASMSGIVTIGVAGPRPTTSTEVMANLVLVVAAWLTGRVACTRQEALAAKAQGVREAARRETVEARLVLADALHDRVGHTIVGVMRQLEAAQALGDREGAALIDRAKERLRAVLGEIGQLITAEPRSPTLAIEDDRFGARSLLSPVPQGPLGAVLGSWASTLASAGVSVHLSVRGSAVGLARATEDLLASIVAEGLANVAGHSAAPEVAVSLSFEPDEVLVSVSDPGPFRPGSNGSGTGLGRLHDAVRRQGGTMSASPSTDGGFELDARLRLAETTKRP